MSTSTNPLAAGVPALQPPSPTQTMVAPDGTPGEIPVEHVQDAVKSGFKLGVRMTAPDGTAGTIPVDKAHDAVKAGFTPAGVSVSPNAGSETYGAGVKKAGSDIYGVATGLAPTANMDAASGVGGKALGLAEDVAQGINNLSGATTVVDSVKNAAHLFDTYEQARSNGASVTQALGAANEKAKQLDAIAPVILQRGTEWKKNPGPETVRALGDAVAAAAAIYGAHKFVTPTVTPDVPTATDFESPSKPSLATSIAQGEPATSKIEPKVAEQTAKAGLPMGTAGVTASEAAEQTAQAAEAAQQATQANTDQALQSIAARHASENSLPAPTVGTASRDIITNSGNALVDAGKANYKILDKFTDGKFTNAQNELKNAQIELQQKAGTTDADTSTLEANVTRAQWNVDQLFDTAIENGMPKDTADAARNQFRTGQATLERETRCAWLNRVRGAAGVRTTDLNALENRWTALYALWPPAASIR